MRTLLALMLALWCGIAEAAVFNNDFTTNAFHATTNGVVVMSTTGHPLNLSTTSTNAFLKRVGTGYTFVDAGTTTNSVGGAGTLNTLPKWTSTNALGDSRITDDTAVMSIASNGADLTGITNSTDVVGIGDFALGSLVGDGLVNIYGIGPSALATATMGPFNGQIFAYGESTLSGAILTNATHIYAFGESAGAALVANSMNDAYLMGNSVLANGTITTATDIYGIGQQVLEGAGINASSQIYVFGSGAISNSILTNNAVGIFAIGNQALSSSTVDAAQTIYAIGSESLSASTLTTFTSDIAAFGQQALFSSALDSSSQIYAIGSGALNTTVFTNNADDVFAIGANSGASATYDGVSHIFMVGSGSKATNANDFVFGDSAYNYFFPGAGATFANYIRLSGNTNQYTDDGSTLLRNGVAISGASETTATNIVTLTMTGTNVSAMDFSLVQRGGAFKLVLTGNGFVGTPSNVGNTVFSKAWLFVQQPSTGTCLLQFTNGTFAAPEGVAPVIDTNNSSVAIFEMVSDPFTNGLVHLSLTPLSKRVP